MQLGLSTDAAPGAALDELLDTCERRGLAALEVRAGAVDAAALHHVLLAQQRRTRIAGLLADEQSWSAEVVTLACTADVPLVLAARDSHAARFVEARRVAPRGCTVLPLMHGAATQWLPAAVQAAAPFAWQIDDTCIDPAGDATQVLAQAQQQLAYVRLVGGGPEAVMQEGRGIGAVMKQLTLAGYDGPLILTPSSPRYRVAWATWLGRRGGWGCGSKAGAAKPLRLATTHGEIDT